MNSRNRIKSELLSKQMMTLDGRGMANVKCICGHIWVTKGDVEDYYLRGGNSIRLSYNEKIVIEGILNSTIEIETA